MDVVEFFSSPYAVCSYIPEYKTVMVVWSGSQTNDEYRRAITECLNYQKNAPEPICNYISDIRQQAIVNPISRKWFEEVALPQATRQGLKRAAVVFDGNAFKRYYFNMILQVATIHKLPLKYFKNKEDAFEWFKSFDG